MRRDFPHVLLKTKRFCCCQTVGYVRSVKKESNNEAVICLREMSEHYKVKVVPFLQFCSEDFCSTVGGCSQVTQDINYNLLGEKKVPRTGSQLCRGKDRTFFSSCCLPNILRPFLEWVFESHNDLEGAAAHADTEWELSLTSCWMKQVFGKEQ